MGDEPIWARIGEPSDAITPQHGFGACRFDAQGQELPRPDIQRDGEWAVAGWVTSGGYAHSIGASMAQGYLPKGLASAETERDLQVEILGCRYPARIAHQPPFDPEGRRMRS